MNANSNPPNLGDGVGVVDFAIGGHSPFGVKGAAVVIAQHAILARLRLVAEARHTFGVKAARQLWFKLELPNVPAMEVDRSRG